MTQDIQVLLAPEQAKDERQVRSSIEKASGLNPKRIKGYEVLRQSIDARGRAIKIQVQVRVYIDETPPTPEAFDPQLQDVRHQKTVVIVGAGPAGLFAALRLISLGIKPIVIERGKDVRSRRRDLAAMNKNGIVNPESN